jgi:hypothetical protein
VENQHISAIGAVDDEVLAHGEASQTRAQIAIAPPAYVRVTGQQIKTLGNGLNQPVCNPNAAAPFAT